VPPTTTLDEIVRVEEDTVAVAELLSESGEGLTREEIDREYSEYEHNPIDINEALGLLMTRALVYTQQEDPTSRVIEALRAEGRNDLFAPYATVDAEQKASAEIRKRINADYDKTGGAVVVRYLYSPAKKTPTARDRSVISKATKDILVLVGLDRGNQVKRNRHKIEPQTFAPGA
jgi:hypothetical protein